jgi:hypothetical protein
MRRSTEFFVEFAGKGWVPYGDHRPWRGRSGNGKNGSAAVVFDLLGTHPDAVAEFGKTVAASYKYREEGHTGAFFSFLWGPPGAIRAPREMFREFVDRQTWYYDLSRTHDGGIVCQPNPENLSGRTPGVYTRWGPGWTTGGMALLYALPTKRLRILGGEKGIFAQRPPASLRKALALFNGKKWREAAAFLESHLKKPGISPGERAYALGLLGACKRLEESATVATKAIDENIQKGDLYLASEQLKALTRLLGEERPQMAELRRVLEGEATEKQIEIAKEYYRALRGYATRPGEWRRMENVAKKGEDYYAKLAAKALAAAEPPPEQPKLEWQTLLASAAGPQLAPKEPKRKLETREADAELSDAALEAGWRYFEWGDAAMPRELAGWFLPELDHSSWKAGRAPFSPAKGKGTVWSKRHIVLRKTFDMKDTTYIQLSLVMNCPPGTQVYLNGYRVVEVVSTPGQPYEPVLLREKAVELLKKGENLIAVYGQKGRGATLDVGLRAARAKGK